MKLLKKCSFANGSNYTICHMLLVAVRSRVRVGNLAEKDLGEIFEIFIPECEIFIVL